MAVVALARAVKSLEGLLGEEEKRLLAAILDLSALIRRDEPHTKSGESGLGMATAMREHGLGQRHASALLAIALWGPMSVSELARRHRVQVKTASLVAVELEQAGLVHRRDDPRDRRRTILSVPKAKEHLIARGLQKRAAPLQRVLSRLTAGQREGLIVGLETLAREMSVESGEAAQPRSSGDGR